MSRRNPQSRSPLPGNGERPTILVTNDDGIHSPGLHALAEAVAPLGDVWILAPDRERSAISHSFTMNHPLRARTIAPQTIILDGTPADCVMFSLRGFLDKPPQLVLAGINRGPNLGEDTIYSGTVAAAHEAYLCGACGVGISLEHPTTRGADDYDFASAARFAATLAGIILDRGLPQGTFLNVNIPHLPWEELQGVAITRLGQRVYHDVIVQRTDPQGNDYFWIGGNPPTWVQAEGTDFHALEEKKISVTPLGQDLTQHHAIPELDRWSLTLPDGDPPASAE